MKITLSKSQWKIIGKEAGWMKKAESSETDGIIYLNKEEHDENFWGHSYKIQLGAIGTQTFIVNASSLQDAVDEIIDHMEKSNPGMLFSYEEASALEFPEEYISGGNHGRTLNIPTHEMHAEEIK